MKRFLVLFILSVLVGGSLAGCGGKGPFRDRGNDYLGADPGRPLVFPAGEDGAGFVRREAWPIPSLEQRRFAAQEERKERFRIPPPPELPAVQDLPPEDSGAGRPVPEARVVQTTDGNGNPVLMLDLDFDWAWQGVGDALREVPGVVVDDLDRGLAIYYLLIDGKGAKGGGPYLLKFNYTANGIQVALQVDEDAMAPADLAEPLVESLREGLLKNQ